ncbi:related to lysophospholipase L1 and related esterases [Phialocephala subalpina]|uniref:Related to lysophospholipase L1 and related esterases n=1 Tax=Phialocephala subalpina TaxID=576137 RepID=A0A1L7XU70_9HELO|nr:related to lysophospholipase L1 and related esterases [Phialocephala subalpina]
MIAIGRRSVVLAATVVLSFCNGVLGGYSWQNEPHWVDTWTTMPQLTEPANLPPAPYNQTGAVFVNSTIRQTLHMSLGGSPIRIRISNAFGLTDLPITAVTVALPFNGSAGVAAIQPQTLHTVTFSGSKNYTIPNGALIVSDPIPMTIAPQSNLAVSIYLEQGQLSATNAITSHPGSRTTSWMSMGNQVSKPNITDATSASVQHWYFVSAVEVLRERSASGWVIVGDSITDGRGSDTDKNDRWPDLVLARMQKNRDTNNIAVLNQAAGGNRILYDGLGPNALGRIDRDVLAQSGIGYAMIFEGVNDIGTAATDSVSQKNVGDRIIAAYIQMVERVHTFGIPMFAATITPFSAPGYNVTAQVYSDPEREATRQRVNAFIRNSGVFDEVIDFDAVLRNESFPYSIQTALQGGDWLHPNSMGYQKIAEIFPLDIF